MKKEIKVLIKNESPSYSSETLVYGDNKFKVVAENGNSYSKLSVYIYTNNGDLALVASCGDIPQYGTVNYISTDHARLLGNANNIKAAEGYIKKVFQ